MTSDAALHAEVWAALAIAPTDDARAIRRAYAERLRRCRPEDDRRGFARLRWAYETACELARGGGQGDAAHDEAGDDDAEENEPEAAAAPPQLDSLPFAPAATEAATEWEAQWARLFLLRAAITRDAPPKEVLGLFEAIVSDPSMANVTVWQAMAEALTAEAARPDRAADLLVGPVLERLGGREAAQEWTATAEQAALPERFRRIELRRQLEDAADPRHRAYRVLTHPPSTRGLRAGPHDIRSLLRTARVDERWLMEDFDARTVAHWNRRFQRNPSLGSRRSLGGLALGLIVRVSVLLLLVLWILLAVVLQDQPGPTGQGVGQAMGAISSAWLIYVLVRRLGRAEQRKKRSFKPPAAAPPSAQSR